jgi:hypothetical protein
LRIVHHETAVDYTTYFFLKAGGRRRIRDGGDNWLGKACIKSERERERERETDREVPASVR